MRQASTQVGKPAGRSSSMCILHKDSNPLSMLRGQRGGQSTVRYTTALLNYKLLSSRCPSSLAPLYASVSAIYIVQLHVVTRPSLRASPSAHRAFHGSTSAASACMSLWMLSTCMDCSRPVVPDSTMQASRSSAALARRAISWPAPLNSLRSLKERAHTQMLSDQAKPLH